MALAPARPGIDDRSASPPRARRRVRNDRLDARLQTKAGERLARDEERRLG